MPLHVLECRLLRASAWIASGASLSQCLAFLKLSLIVEMTFLTRGCRRRTNTSHCPRRISMVAFSRTARSLCVYYRVHVRGSRIYLNQRARAYSRRVIVDAPTATGRLSNSRLVCTSATLSRDTNALSFPLPSPRPPPPARVKRIPTRARRTSLPRHSMRSPLYVAAHLLVLLSLPFPSRLPFTKTARLP